MSLIIIATVSSKGMLITSIFWEYFITPATNTNVGFVLIVCVLKVLYVIFKLSGYLITFFGDHIRNVYSITSSNCQLQ